MIDVGTTSDMTLAVLSFETRKSPSRVRFRCDDLHIDEGRDLEPNPPFADWIGAYETGHWTRETLLAIGLAIGCWLDTPEYWLTRFAAAPAPGTLVIETTKHPDSVEQAALDAPWELIARVDAKRAAASAPEQRAELPPSIHALMATLGSVDWQHVHHAAFEPGFLLRVVRRLGPATQSPRPSKYRLSVVFMPCQPDGAGIAVDAHEAAIREVSRGSGIDLEVEDSGSLEGLGEVIARLGDSDVIHVSCPATTTPRAALALEGQRGEHVDATASDLRSKIGKTPRLLVLSLHAAPGAADTVWAQNAAAAAVGSRVLQPLATELCQSGWPAVVGVPGVSADQADIDFAAALYRLLAQRVSLVEAFALARAASADSNSALWHKARLLLGPGGGGQLVAGTRARPAWAAFIGDQRFLDSNRRIPVAVDYQASVHRRPLQRVVATLRGGESPGVVVHGGNERSRVAFVSHVLRRMERELRRVVVTGAVDTPGILRAIHEQIAHPEVAALAAQHRKLRGDPEQLRAVLRAIVEGPCRERGAGAFVLVLHDVDLTSTAERVLLFRALLGAFDGTRTASRLLVTCEAPCPALDDDGQDVAPQLTRQLLDAGADHGGSWQIAPPSPPSVRWRIPAAGVAIVGGCAALMVWRQHEHPKPPPDPPNMVRFQAADVYLGVFAAFPDDCRQLPIDENCAEWRHPESVRATHIAAFELDRKEATNDDFSAWLNVHANDWSLEADGVVTDRKTHLPLLATTACTGDLLISPDGRARPTASAAQRPVTCVTWYGSEMYCRTQNKRLPFEAEWEFAAKGAAGRLFPWGTDTDHMDGVAYQLSASRAVGTSAKDVSPEGVYDLAGNVAEWVQSERNTPDKRVVRGGSYLSDEPCRLLGSKCARISVKNVGRNVGFRCARNADEPSQSQARTQ